MKTAIWEYIIPSEREKENLWNNCTFVFDTNVLLNLYRYTGNTRRILLEAFKDLKGRMWLPYQVAYEYARNRCDVIYETVEKYNKLETLENDFIKKIAEELRLKNSDAEIGKLQNMIAGWIGEQKQGNLIVTKVSDDKILNQILSLFNKKVGEPYSEEEMQNVLKEGKERYSRQLPPGFCDAGKEAEEGDNNAYGDFVIWKQIMEYAGSKKSDIIYVTHDQKKDWWQIAKGRTVGPRIELRKEFAEKTKQRFYMYSMESFLEYYSRHKGQTTDPDVLDEVSFIEKKQSKKRKDVEELYWDMMYLEQQIENMRERIESRQKAVSRLEKKYGGREMPEHITEQLNNMRLKLARLRSHMEGKMQRLLSVREKFFVESE